MNLISQFSYMFFFLKVAFLIGGDFLTRADHIPNCVDTYSFPTVITALGALYAKRSQLQPPVYNVNEQFSPNVHLPWSCSFETFWKDLGEAYFPRFVKDGVCVSAACWYGHYTCQSIYYNMNVIVKQHNNRCVDRHLPSVLASDWRLAEVNITVSCICARK